MKNNIKIIKLDHAKDLDIPKYETLGSAGVDLYAATKKDIIIKRNKYKLIPTGIKIALPDLFEAQIRPRSGIAFKYGVTVLILKISTLEGESGCGGDEGERTPIKIITPLEIYNRLI